MVSMNCIHKCTYCGISMKDNDALLNKQLVKEPTSVKYLDKSHSFKLSSSVIANLSMPEKDLQYLLSCKVLLKPLCIVRIFPLQDFSN